MRLSWDDINFDTRSAHIGKTKNGDPVTVHLAPPVVAALTGLKADESAARPGRAFGLAKCGRIYSWLDQAAKTAGVELPKRSAFHILRHTHAAWRRRHTGADTSALVATGLWKSHEAARIYEHVGAGEEARKSDLLPTSKCAEPVR